MIAVFEKTLFLRILACFWVAMGLITAIVIALTSLTATARRNFPDGVGPATLALQAAALLHQGGLPALRPWAEEIHDNHAMKVYVVDRDCIRMAGRRTQTRICDRIRAHVTQRKHTNIQSDALTTTALAGYRASWRDVHDLTAPDGARYMLTFLPCDSSYMDVLRDSSMRSLLLLLAIALSAPVCWLLARYIDHPMRQLALDAQALGDGYHPACTDARLLQRNDGCGFLARTFRRMADKITDQLQSRERLLGDVSHELRSPLTRLRLALELARRKTPHADAHFDRIERECSHMDTMIGQLLQLARLRNAPPELPEPLDLRDVVQQVVADARFEAANQERKINWRRPDYPLPVLGVPLLLRSVLENVVRNALRYAPFGSTIEVVAWRDASGVVAEIGDDGPGVADADLERLFQPFFRASQSDVLGKTGTGLGLAIAADVVNQHGGHIEARNRVAQSGLIVRIALPEMSIGDAPSVAD
nr:HAMP domain-containing sensor histidine kinase [Duganella violaceicalia]